MSLDDYLMDDYDSRNGDDGNDMYARTDTSDPDLSTTATRTTRKSLIIREKILDEETA